MTHLEIKHTAAVTAINAMMRKSFFSICTIDEVAKMLGVHPEPESHSILRSLHCVDFASMPNSLYNQIPLLIQQSLSGATTFEFHLAGSSNYPSLNVINVSMRKKGLLQRIFNHD